MKRCFVDFLNHRGERTRIKRITGLSLNHGILSPYTAFVGVERTGPRVNADESNVRHIRIQVSKGDEGLFFRPIPSYVPVTTPMGIPGMMGYPYGSLLPQPFEVYGSTPSVAYARVG